MVLDSSTVMTPSLPTFFMASAMMPPLCLSLLAEMVPTWAIMSPLTSLCSFLISSTATSTALSMPRFRAVGLSLAATVFTPSRKIACASTVAVVVPSPATSDVLEATSRTICAPMFSRESSSSISLATVTPSLVIVGEPNFLSSTTLRPFGPSVTFTARLNFSTPRSSALRASSSNNNCFAAMFNHSFTLTLFNHAEDIFLAHDQVIFAVNLDFRAAVLADQHAVTFLHGKRDELAVVVTLAGAEGDDFALLRLFFRGVRDDDPALLHFVLFNRLHQHAIAQWFYVHCVLSPVCCCFCSCSRS